MLRHTTRGRLFIGFGLFFTLLFLIGGGVVTGTDGKYWTAIFGVGYLLGLVIAGPWVYRSARASHSTDSRPTATAGHYLAGSLIVGLMFVGSLMFLRSDLFASDPVQHAFMIVMGSCLAQFVPLGFGFLQVQNNK